MLYFSVGSCSLFRSRWGGCLGQDLLVECEKSWQEGSVGVFFKLCYLYFVNIIKYVQNVNKTISATTSSKGTKASCWPSWQNAKKPRRDSCSPVCCFCCTAKRRWCTLAANLCPNLSPFCRTKRRMLSTSCCWKIRVKSSGFSRLLFYWLEILFEDSLWWRWKTSTTSNWKPSFWRNLMIWKPSWGKPSLLDAFMK